MINGLDISHYQENELYNQYINWEELAKDSRNFKFIWIKSSEGELLPTESGAYPVEIFRRQVEGARSIGLEVNPYHFYYYHVQWSYNPDGSINYYVLSPTRQAVAFAESCNGFFFKHPLTDCEDPNVGKFLTWSNTEEANKAIAFALKLNAHLKKYHEEVTRLLSKPDIYTGKWWWDRFAKLLADNGYINEIAWMKDYNVYAADYSHTTPGIPYGLGKVLAWQYTSTPTEPVQGIPNGNHVDMAVWYATEQEYQEWIGETQMESGIYKKTVLNENKATFTVFSDEDKSVDMSKVTSDLVMLRMANQAVTGMLTVPDTAFKIRRTRIPNKPVFGWVNLDANLFWKKEIDLNDFNQRTMYQNETIRDILWNWRIDGFTDSEWNAGTLNFNAVDGGWYNLSGIVFFLFSTIYYSKGTPINGMWQYALVRDQVKILKDLMDGGDIPKIPMYVIANADFYKEYSTDPTFYTLNLLDGLTGCGIIELGLDHGLFVEIPMATPFATMDELFYNPEVSLRPSNSYAYSFIPNGFNPSFDIYSSNRFLVEGISNPLLVGLWCDTKEELYKFINFYAEQVPSSSPSPSQEIPPTNLEERVTELEKWVRKIIAWKENPL